MDNEARESKNIACKKDFYGNCDKYIDFDDAECCGCFGKDYSTCKDFEEQNNGK